MATVSIKNFTRQRVPRFAYEAVVESRLKNWEISLVFAGPARAKRLNHDLRGKTYVPNVLSYQVGPRSGEIIVCIEAARREAPKYGHSFETHVLYLFIHGILHLEGRPHGATMEQWEQKLLTRFAVAIPRTRHESSHRHRH